MIYNPAEKTIEYNLIELESDLSASLPPKWYPMLNPARITPIRLPQVYIESPNIGTRSRLAENSNDIVTTPVIKTIITKARYDSAMTCLLEAPFNKEV